MSDTFLLSRENLDNLMPNSFVTDTTGRFIHTGQVMCKLRKRTACVDTNLTNLFTLNDSSAGGWRWALQNAGQYRVDLHDGRAKHLKLHLCPLEDRASILGCVVIGAGFIRQMDALNITDADLRSYGSAMDMFFLLEMQRLFLNQTERSAERLDAARNQALLDSQKDALTGIDNRRVFEQHVQNLSETIQFKPFALILIDLDGFKAINDTHGHPTGDAVLQVVAKRLRGAIRKSDMIARLGGDEFGAVFYDINDATPLKQICANLIALIESPIMVHDLQCMVSASIGVGYITRPNDIEIWLKQTDDALYKAKSDGKGRAQIKTL